MLIVAKHGWKRVYLHRTHSECILDRVSYVTADGFNSTSSSAYSPRSFAVAVVSTLYILRSSYYGRHKRSRVYHYLSALVRPGWLLRCSVPEPIHCFFLEPPFTQITLIMSLTYLTMAIGSLPGSPLASACWLADSAC